MISPVARALSFRSSLTGLGVLTAVYAAVVVVASAGAETGWYDEAIPLVHARQIMRGLLPHVDFYSFYPPLAYYLNVAAFTVFGKTVIAQRLIQAAFYIAILLAARKVLRKNLPDRPYSVSCTVLLLSFAIGPRMLLPPWQGIALALLALFAYLYEPGSWRSVLLSASLTSLAIFCRINFGVYAAFIVTANLIVDWLRYRRTRDLQLAALFTGTVAITCAALFLPVYGKSIGALIEQSILIPMGEQARLRFFNLPPSTGLAIALVFPCAWYCARMILGQSKIPAKAAFPAALGVMLLALAGVFHADSRASGLLAMAEIASVLILQVFVHRLERLEFSFLLLFACCIQYYLTLVVDDAHWAPLVCVAALLFPYLPSTRGSAVVLCALAISLT